MLLSKSDEERLGMTGATLSLHAGAERKRGDERSAAPDLDALLFPEAPELTEIRGGAGSFHSPALPRRVARRSRANIRNNILIYQLGAKKEPRTGGSAAEALNFGGTPRGEAGWLRVWFNVGG